MPRKTHSSNLKAKYIPTSVLENIFTILRTHDYDMYLYIKTIYYTISRPQEIANLQYFHLKALFNYIEIPMIKTHRVKTLEHANELINELLTYSSGRPYIFNSQDTRSYSNKWNKIMQELGLRSERSNGRFENDFDIKHLRHTAITNIANSHNLEYAQKLAGHSKVSTTKGYYQSVATLKESTHTFKESTPALYVA
ncbi:MAG: tyrosine-type recombinase/integrase [Brevinema sp.]